MNDMFPKTAKNSGTNVTFEQNSKIQFTAVMVNISKGAGEDETVIANTYDDTYFYPG